MKANGKDLTPGQVVKALITNFDQQRLTAQFLERLEENAADLREQLSLAISPGEHRRFVVPHKGKLRLVEVHGTDHGVEVRIFTLDDASQLIWPMAEAEAEAAPEPRDSFSRN